MSKAFFGCIRTSLSTEAGTEFQTNQALARRQEELEDYGSFGYVLTSTISVPALDRVTIVDTLQRIVED